MIHLEDDVKVINTCPLTNIVEFTLDSVLCGNAIAAIRLSHPCIVYLIIVYHIEYFYVSTGTACLTALTRINGSTVCAAMQTVTGSEIGEWRVGLLAKVVEGNNRQIPRFSFQRLMILLDYEKNFRTIYSEVSGQTDLLPQSMATM